MMLTIPSILMVTVSLTLLTSAICAKLGTKILIPEKLGKVIWGSGTQKNKQTKKPNE